MRTTINLEDDLLRRAKARAAENGKSLTAFLEDCLRQALAPRSPAPKAFKLKLETVAGPLPKGVDFSNREPLYRWLEGGE